MAAMRVAPGAVMLARSIFRPPLHSLVSLRLFLATSPPSEFTGLRWRAPAGYCAVRCNSTKSGGQDNKTPARLAEVQRLLHEAEERYKAAGSGAEPIPKITIGMILPRYALFVLIMSSYCEFRYVVLLGNLISDASCLTNIP